MPAAGQIIQLFVSSTFADFALERTILQRRVFPALRQECQAAGFRFQPIDLRWGINQEASESHQTLGICFEEIARCQRLSPDCNFLILLGDRYGSQLLPETIPAAEFDQLAQKMDDAGRHLLTTWYRQDLNALSEEYVLLPRGGTGAGWEQQVAVPLLAALARACDRARFTPAQALRYTGSVTHQEIQRGLLQGNDPTAVVVALRTFAQTPRGPHAAHFVEQDGARRKQLQPLRRDVERTLHDLRLDDHLLRYNARWQGDAPTLDESFWAGSMHDLLARQVRRVMAQRAQAQPSNRVFSVNQRFIEERTEQFVGRTDALGAIAVYLAKQGSQIVADRAPLVLTGPGGSGKSTLLAAALRQAQRDYPQAVISARFISVTPGTATLADLLQGLRQEIAAAYGQPMPVDLGNEYRLAQEFPLALQAATAARPLILVIDALDQLGPTHSLDWLPTIVPPHVRVIVSLLSEHVEVAVLAQRLPANQFLALGALNEADGAALLDRWLAATGRTLQPDQRQAVLQAFIVAGRPLYLRLAFAEARRWPSFAPPPALPPQIPDLLGVILARLSADAQHGPILVSHALGLVQASRDGLAEDELLDVLAVDAGLRDDLHRIAPFAPPIDPALPLPVVLWARLFAEIEPYLTERELDGTRLITFYHRQLSEVVAVHYLSGPARFERHRALAAYFTAQPIGFGATTNQRKLAELPFQQAQGAQWSELQTTLTDATFLQTLLVARGSGEVQNALRLRPDEPLLQQMAHAFIAANAVLSQHPDQMVNQLQGRAGILPHLHHLPDGDRPHFLLVSPSLIPPDPAQVMVLAGHRDAILTSAISPDDRHILSGGADKTLRLWDSQTGATIWLFSGHAGNVNCCAFSPDGRSILSGSGDTTLRLWDVATGDQLSSYGQTIATGDSPTTREGRQLGGSGGAAIAGDLQARGVMPLTAGQPITGCAFTPDGHSFVSNGPGAAVQLWDVATGQVVRTFTEPQRVGPVPSQLHRCAISPDGQLVMAVVGPDTLMVWDLATGATRQAITLPLSRNIRCVAFAAGARLACVGGRFGYMELWDLTTGEQRWKYVAKDESDVNDCVFSADGTTLLTVGEDKLVRLCDPATGQRLRTFAGHGETLLTCAISPDVRIAVSGSGDLVNKPNEAVLRVWDLRLALTEQAMRAHTRTVSTCFYYAGGSRALSRSWRDGTLRLWDTTTCQTLQVITAKANCVRTDDDRLIAYRTSDPVYGKGRDTAVGWIAFTELLTGAPIQNFTLPPEYDVHQILLGPSGHMAYAAAHKAALQWDLVTGNLVRTFDYEKQASQVHGIALSPDGQRLLTQDDGGIHLWGTATGQRLWVITPRFFIEKMVFAADGQTFFYTGNLHRRASALIRATTSTGTTLREYRGHDNEIMDCAISVDQRWVITTSRDRTLRLWDVARGNEVMRWETDSQLFRCAFHPNGRQVMVGDELGDLHFLAPLGI